MRCFILFYFVCAGLGVTSYAEEWEVVAEFRAPTSTTNGLAWDGTHLWAADDLTPRFYKLNPETGSILKTIVLKGSQVLDPGDITWLHGALWVIEENAHTLVKVNPNNGVVLDVIRLNGLPSGQIEGLATDGKYLWVCGAGHYVVKVNPKTRQQVTEFTVKGMGRNEGMDGLTWAWGHLFTVTNGTQNIIEIHPVSGQELSVFKAPAGKNWGPEGLAFDGEYLWYADLTTRRIYKILLKDDYFR